MCAAKIAAGTPHSMIKRLNLYYRFLMPTFTTVIDGAEIVIKSSAMTGKETVIYDGQVVSERTSMLYMSVHSFNVQRGDTVDVYEVNVIGGLTGHGFAVRKNGIIMAHEP